MINIVRMFHQLKKRIIKNHIQTEILFKTKFSLYFRKVRAKGNY